MGRKQIYSDEVWFYIKTIYEKVDIGLDSLIKIIEAETNLELPTKQVIYQKAKRQGWVKPSRKISDSDRAVKRAKSVFADIKIIKKENNIVTVDGDKEIFLTPDNLQVLSKIEYKDRNSRAVILEHRRRSGRVGILNNQLVDRLSDLLERKHQLFDAILDARKLVDDDPINTFLMDDLDHEDQAFNSSQAEKNLKKLTEEKMLIDNEIGMLNAQLEIIESQARTTTILGKLDFALFGITPDDTKEAQTDNRLSHLQDDTVYDEELEYLDAQCIDMSKRAAMIASGQFEEQVQQEAEEIMRQQEAEDTEYFERNPDDTIHD